MVGRKFKYSEVDNSVQSRELKAALDLLECAGAVCKVRQTSGTCLPLEADADDRNFKVAFMDVGLMQNLCGLRGEALMTEDLLGLHAGALAEQFVGQELVALREPSERPALHYWAREARTSNAEVDYLVAHGWRVLPLEVKSGKTGSLRSMHLFLKQYGAPCGIRVAQQPMGCEPPVVSTPLYALESLGRLVAEAMSRG
jgi:predicted AAA+ superfamily ATPase